jgi:hypothetical protein
VLARNRRGNWTCPSEQLYPHQWLWDSCFVAIGLARDDPERAASELRALLRGQWTNGMLPHMIFADDVHDVSSDRIWQSRRHPAAPRDVATSCITQPPVIAVATHRVAECLAPDLRRAFLNEMYPHLVAYHEWLYRERDPSARGLVALIHPWECGLDTTPPWMQALGRLPQPWWARVITRLHAARLLRFLRRDTKYVPTIQRSTDDEGLGMLVLVQTIRKHDFALAQLPADRSLAIEDLAFNCILIAANRALVAIAEQIGADVPPALTAAFERAARALDDLWDDSTGQYFSRDARTNEFLCVPTISGLLPLFAGVVPSDRVERLAAQLLDPSAYWTAFPVPTVSIDSAEFREQTYWKGPTWLNMNWMIIDALAAHGHVSLSVVGAGRYDRSDAAFTTGGASSGADPHPRLQHVRAVRRRGRARRPRAVRATLWCLRRIGKWLRRARPRVRRLLRGVPYRCCYPLRRNAHLEWRQPAGPDFERVWSDHARGGHIGRMSHGWARSSCAPTQSNRSSRPNAATSCTPSGMPSWSRARGNEIAG